MESSGLADACVGYKSGSPCNLFNLTKGTVLQLERKGFFRIDRPYGGTWKPAVLFAILMDERRLSAPLSLQLEARRNKEFNNTLPLVKIHCQNIPTASLISSIRIINGQAY